MNEASRDTGSHGIANDPLLACIVRFVKRTDASEHGDEEFLQLQIKTLKRHLLQFPADEQDDRAMDWVAQHAANYRRYWQRRTISERTWSLRCDDCPIADRGAGAHCEIHEQWLYLLRRYMLGEIRSRDYVESALALLQRHKDALIARRTSLRAEDPGSDPSPTDKLRIKKKKKKSNKKKHKTKMQRDRSTSGS